MKRLLIRDRFVRAKMSETSPGAAGLLTDNGDAAVSNETPAFVARLNTGQPTLAGWQSQLALGAHFRHYRLPETLRTDKEIVFYALPYINM